MVVITFQRVGSLARSGVLSVDARFHDEDLQVLDVHTPGWCDNKY